ncbi:hypothetical protein AUEXF2481DRAFT_44969, partial [Aureobasidium subglaciale EXF-2481]
MVFYLDTWTYVRGQSLEYRSAHMLAAERTVIWGGSRKDLRARWNSPNHTVWAFSIARRILCGYMSVERRTLSK